MDSGEIPPLLIRISPTDPSSHMGETVRIMEDHMTNAQISHSIEAIENDLEMDLSTIRAGTSKTMEIFPVLHRLKGDTSRKIIPTAN